MLFRSLMSRELILKHPQIRDYTTIWMDTLRGGASELTNTNRLIRFYPGATGLKTGSTDAARYCLSATAERDGMELISVVMKAPTSAQRFTDARTLLDHGFASYALQRIEPEQPLRPIPVRLGTAETVTPVLGEGSALLLEKASAGALEQTLTVAEGVDAPVAAGQRLGTLTVRSGEMVLKEFPLLSPAEIPRLTYGQLLFRLVKAAFLVK